MFKPRSLLLALGLVGPLWAHPALAADGFPVTVQNCGSAVTLAAAPKRVFIVNTDDIALLDALGALDLVVARTSEPVANLYAEELYGRIAAIPLIATSQGATGGSVISLEAILATEPDLVLAPESAVDRSLLAEAGIPLYSPPAYCNDPSQIPGGTASFERVYEQLARFGTLLGRSEQAEARIAELKAEVAALATAPSHGTGFALYVGAGGKALYPYGARSMVTPVFAAAGLANVYAQTDERVFEAGMEELLGRDPDVIVLLYGDGTPEKVLADFQSVPGVETFKAVRTGHVVALPFSFTDPPTPLSIKGASALAAKLDALP